MPKVRRDAVMYAKKHGVRAAARYYGYQPGTISKWKKKMETLGYGEIPTQSSAPKTSPNELPAHIVNAIIKARENSRGRCAEVVHKLVTEQGIETSLSSVKRTLDRRGYTKKRSPWKRLHISQPRPITEKPGDLVQVDTIHIMTGEKTRIYVFTLIDVYSRWTHARSYSRCNTRTAVDFLKRAQAECCFTFNHIQSDNGPEFSKSFTDRAHIPHRHSRVRTPNDNAHLERFNRTLQEECLDKIQPSVRRFNQALTPYLEYYNNERYHLGIDLKTPRQIIRCFQGVD